MTDLVHDARQLADQNRPLVTAGAALVLVVLFLAAVAAIGPVDPATRAAFIASTTAAPATTSTTSTTSPPTSTTSTAPALVATDPAPAVRGTAFQATDTLPPPPSSIPTGIDGLPFAPPGLDACDRAVFYAAQFGLDQVSWRGMSVESVIWRESNCRNDVSTWCCYGYFQVYADIWVGSESRRECGVTSLWDYYAATPEARQRSACMARIVYDQQGPCAWDVVRC